MKIGIVGAGISGLMAAYKLADNGHNVTIFEKGNSLEDRKCPLLLKKVEKCVKCNHCAITEGVAGAGAFSDGKYNITTEFGGWLQDILPSDKVLDKIEEVDAILQSCGGPADYFQPSNELKKKCIQQDLYMLQSKCKHLGTERNYEIMRNLVALLTEMGVDIQTNVEVMDVFNRDNSVYVDINDYNVDRVFGYAYLPNTYKFDRVIFAVGRVGSSFMYEWCEKNKVELHNNQVDIGVRVELPAMIWEEFEKKIYEPKVLYTSKKYGDVTRMFCFNGRGEVVIENSGNILTVNGHAYNSEELKTENTNFALLSTIRFTQPFDKPINYAKHVAALANMISGGSVLVQRLGDLEQGRRTDESRMKKCRVKPSLKSAVAGDLSLCMPKRQLDNIIETLHALDKIALGTANGDTLLYGIECKYYSARPNTNGFELVSCEKELKGIYAVGDGAGFTRSLAQAGANGLLVAEQIQGE